jgi:hypothetical protein
MSGHQISRRHWLAVAPLSATALAAQQHAHQAMRSTEPAPFTVLSPPEAMGLGAIGSPCTIQTLAYRAADHLAGQARKAAI